jgi:hypothetical protein
MRARSTPVRPSSTRLSLGREENAVLWRKRHRRPKVTRLAVLAALRNVVMALGGASDGQALGATTMRRASFPICGSTPPHTLSPCSDWTSADVSFINLGSSPSPELCEATTVTFHGCPRYRDAIGDFAFGSLIIGRSLLGQSALVRPSQIHAANQKQSAQSPYITSTSAEGTPAITSANFSRSTILGSLSLARASSASFMRALASDISFDVSSLYRSMALSEAAASLLWETIEPAVVTPAAMAANATAINDTISQKSHHSPFWPRNRVEAAALALSIVSVIGGLLVAAFGMIALRELRKKP